MRIFLCHGGCSWGNLVRYTALTNLTKRENIGIDFREGSDSQLQRGEGRGGGGHKFQKFIKIPKIFLDNTHLLFVSVPDFRR